jgi:hypothetical protein
MLILLLQTRYSGTRGSFPVKSAFLQNFAALLALEFWEQTIRVDLTLWAQVV